MTSKPLMIKATDLNLLFGFKQRSFQTCLDTESDGDQSYDSTNALNIFTNRVKTPMVSSMNEAEKQDESAKN